MDQDSSFSSTELPFSCVHDQAGHKGVRTSHIFVVFSIFQAQNSVFVIQEYTRRRFP